VETKGEQPIGRGGHCSFLIGTKMFVFGGYDGRTHFNDLWVLDTEKWEWSQPETTGMSPEVRSGHTATVVGKTAFIISGCGANTNFLNDVHVFNTGMPLFT
jgi:N-acetylneuraminic acid mutarotase